MADSSLDDFFAKKDKSKKKSKAKITGTGEILPSAEEPVKKVKKKKKKEKENPETQQTDNSTSNKTKEQEEEWKDYEAEEETDYSGLRIQTLQIATKEEEDEQERERKEDGEEDCDRKNRDGKQGPWYKGKKTGTNVPVTPPEQAVPEEVPPPPPPAAVEAPQETKAPTRYVPPGLRRALEAQSSATPLRHFRKKQAPDIKSEEDFPTLGGFGGSSADYPETGGSKAAQFETVTGGGRQYQDPSQRTLKLELGNKFEALTPGDT